METDCPLCVIYVKEDRRCVGCPLYESTGEVCFSMDSLFGKVDDYGTSLALTRHLERIAKEAGMKV